MSEVKVKRLAKRMHRETQREARAHGVIGSHPTAFEACASYWYARARAEMRRTP